MVTKYDIFVPTPQDRVLLQSGLMVREGDIGKYVVAGKYHDEDFWRFLGADLKQFWRKGKDGCAWLHEAFAVKDVVMPQKDKAMLALGFKITVDPKTPLQLLLVKPRLKPTL